MFSETKLYDHVPLPWPPCWTYIHWTKYQNKTDIFFWKPHLYAWIDLHGPLVVVIRGFQFLFFLMLCGFTSNTSTRPRMHTRIKVLVCFTLKEDHDASKSTSTCTQISIFDFWACSVSLVFMLVLIIHSKMLDYTRITVNNIKCLYLPDRFIILDPIDRDWCWV